LADQETANEHDREMNELTFQNNSKLSTQSYQESSALSAQSSAQSERNSINAENRADAREAANPKSADTTLSKNGQTILDEAKAYQLTSEGSADPAATKLVIGARIQNALDYGLIDDPDAQMLALQFDIPIQGSADAPVDATTSPYGTQPDGKPPSKIIGSSGNNNQV